MKIISILISLLISNVILASFVSYNTNPDTVYPLKNLCESKEQSPCFKVQGDYSPEFYDLIDGVITKNQVKYDAYMVKQNAKIAKKNAKEKAIRDINNLNLDEITEFNLGVFKDIIRAIKY